MLATRLQRTNQYVQQVLQASWFLLNQSTRGYEELGVPVAAVPEYLIRIGIPNWILIKSHRMFGLTPWKFARKPRNFKNVCEQDVRLDQLESKEAGRVLLAISKFPTTNKYYYFDKVLQPNVDNQPG